MRELLVRSAVVVFSVVLILGLAVAGWGGWDAYFANRARLALVIVTVVMTVVASFTQGNISKGVREDRGNRWVIAVTTIIGLLQGFVPAYMDRMDVWTVGGDGVRWTGVAVYTAGSLLRIWPVFVLGRRFSGLVAIQQDHTLMTGGIYRLIRHPSYLGMIVGSVGWGLVFRSVAGVLLAFALIPPLAGRIRAEERLLSEQFGEDYERYRASTPMFFPRF